MGVTAPAQRPAPFGLRALLTLGRATCGPLSAMTPSSWDTRSGEGVRAGHQPRHHPCQPSIDRRPSGPPLIQGKVRDGICPSCVGTEAVLAKRWPERAGNHDGAERRASVPTALRVSPNLAALWLPDLGELLLLSGFTSCLPVGFPPPPPRRLGEFRAWSPQPTAPRSSSCTCTNPKRPSGCPRRRKSCLRWPEPRTEFRFT